jgi:hypothetical protein
LSGNRLIKFLQHLSDSDFPIRTEVSGTSVLGTKTESFAEFSDALLKVKPRHLHHVELNDIWSLKEGEIRLSTKELVIPEKALSAGAGGPRRAEMLIRFSDACIRNGPALTEGRLSMSAVWREIAQPDDIGKAGDIALNWVSSCFFVSR